MRYTEQAITRLPKDLIQLVENQVPLEIIARWWLRLEGDELVVKGMRLLPCTESEEAEVGGAMPREDGSVDMATDVVTGVFVEFLEDRKSCGSFVYPMEQVVIDYPTLPEVPTIPAPTGSAQTGISGSRAARSECRADEGEYSRISRIGEEIDRRMDIVEGFYQRLDVLQRVQQDDILQGDVIDANEAIRFGMIHATRMIGEATYESLNSEFFTELYEEELPTLVARYPGLIGIDYHYRDVPTGYGWGGYRFTDLSTITMN